ncbi:hypothetical protein WJ542_31565 [Paraburkholderia sp. B3]|uniref:hypothetical protein n=1 Tax=Paraburkholderia sp. B3 TaxID=3134791 RepID=UPI00398225D0
MRLSFVFLTVAVSFASTVCAAQSGTAATASAQSAAAAVPAATDKVYPPLPTLAMLPPPTSDDDDETAPATHRASKHGKKSRRPECHCSAPSPHLVVSDESRAYLQDVERKLDVALAR